MARGAADPFSRLTSKQSRALAVLVVGGTAAEAAAAAKTTPQTVARWQREEAFLAELERLFKLTRHRIEGALSVVASDSVRVIQDAMRATDSEGNVAHGTRLRAAEAAQSAYMRLSERPVVQQAPSVGPLIILPPGTAPMALTIDATADVLPRLPAGELAPVPGEPTITSVIGSSKPVNNLAPGSERSESETTTPSGPGQVRANPSPAVSAPRALPAWWRNTGTSKLPR